MLVLMGRAEEIFREIEDGQEAAIDRFILTRATEELFLDFKRSGDNGGGQFLHDDDRRNFAKAISGFGNSEGGVVVWGIDCSKDKKGADVAKAKIPLIDAQKFRSLLEGAVSSSTIPAHRGVRSIAIATAGTAGYVATLIPASDSAPHQVIVRGEYLYYMRAGSDFVRVPHMVLAGMFGRRPQPHVFNMFNVTPAHYEPGDVIQCTIEFVLRNNGPGIATDLFSNVWVKSFPGTCQFAPMDAACFEQFWSYGMHFSVISKRDVRLPPEGFLNPFRMDIALQPPFTKDVVFEGIAGADGTIPHRFVFRNDVATVLAAFEYFAARHKSGTLTEADTFQFASQALGIP